MGSYAMPGALSQLIPMLSGSGACFSIGPLRDSFPDECLKVT
jgi:hypothetical protein